MNSASTYRNVRWLFLANAIINWIVSLPGIFDPSRAAVAFGGVEPHYPSLIRLWQGFVFMFGCMFWEVSRDDHRQRDYTWFSTRRYSATSDDFDYFHQLGLDSVYRLGGDSGKTRGTKPSGLTRGGNRDARRRSVQTFTEVAM
jgi:hypothetical protein